MRGSRRRDVCLVIAIGLRPIDRRRDPVSAADSSLQGVRDRLAGMRSGVSVRQTIGGGVMGVRKQNASPATSARAHTWAERHASER